MNLTDLEALEAEATPGPWHAEGEGYARGPSGTLVIEASTADATFIAALRNAAPELIRLARLGEAWEESRLADLLEDALVPVTRPLLFPGDKGAQKWREKTARSLAREVAAALQEGADRG